MLLDNKPPYQDYLPSKIVSYVLSQKPIILFGWDENSAANRFLLNYPRHFFFKYNQTIASDLLQFINENLGSNEPYNQSLFDEYKDYQNEKVATQLMARVFGSK